MSEVSANKGQVFFKTNWILKGFRPMALPPETLFLADPESDEIKHLEENGTITRVKRARIFKPNEGGVVEIDMPEDVIVSEEEPVVADLEPEEPEEEQEEEKEPVLNVDETKTPLPSDFPYGTNLRIAGYIYVETVAKATDEQLRDDVSGIGPTRLTQIRQYLSDKYGL